MRLKWHWWLADIICFLLVIVSLYYRPNEQSNAFTLATKHPSEMAKSAKVSDNNSSRNPAIHCGEGSRCDFPQKKNVAIAPPAEANGPDLSRTSTVSTGKDYSVSKSNSASVAAVSQIIVTSVILEELKNCLPNDDLRTALYGADFLLSDQSQNKTALPYYALGRTLYKNGNIPDAISSFEKGLASDDEYSRGRGYRCSAYFFLTLSYYKIGNIEKAWQCFNKANENVISQKNAQELEEVKHILETQKY